MEATPLLGFKFSVVLGLFFGPKSLFLYLFCCLLIFDVTFPDNLFQFPEQFLQMRAMRKSVAPAETSWRDKQSL